MNGLEWTVFPTTWRRLSFDAEVSFCVSEVVESGGQARPASEASAYAVCAGCALPARGFPRWCLGTGGGARWTGVSWKKGYGREGVRWNCPA